MNEADSLQRTAAPMRGVILPRERAMPFRVSRWDPPASLAPFIVNLWGVRWSLPEGVEHIQHTLPHPVLHVVFEAGDADVVGPIDTRFERRLVGTGWVLGVHFRPAAFRVLCDRSVRGLLNQRVPVLEHFGSSTLELARRLPPLDSDSRNQAVCGWLSTVLPRTLPRGLRVLRDTAEHMMESPDAPGIAALAGRLGISERTLQRRFSDAIGWSPKALLGRRRIHDALAALDADPQADLAAVALRVGYADQAHFSRDFRKHTGLSPTQYTGRR